MLNQKKSKLLVLNLKVAAKIKRDESITLSGALKNYSDATELVLEDCIKPSN